MLESEKALSLLPSSLRGELLDAFLNVTTNFRERRWEPSELNGGKLCEVTYSILKGYIDGSYPAGSYKPSNMVDACNALATADSSVFPRSVRIQIPRLLIGLYEVRNNRGVGHVGGEVDPNHMDAVVVLYMSKWIMAELVRVFHGLSTTQATDVVEALIEREMPIIWEVNGKKRVLSTAHNMKEKTLLLLYSDAGSVNEADLVSWTEHTNTAVYRRDILVKGHRSRLWEYDKINKHVTLSPLGSDYVEQKLLT